jgi:hypothetical protein
VGVGGVAGVLVLVTDKTLDTVASRLASLADLGQRNITSGLARNALSNVVALLVRLAVVVNLASRGRLRLGGRSHGKAGKHDGNNESGLHFCGWWLKVGKKVRIDDSLVGKEC